MKLLRKAAANGSFLCLDYDAMEHRISRIYSRVPQLFFEDAKLIHHDHPKVLEKIYRLQAIFEEMFPIPVSEINEIKASIESRIHEVKVICALSEFFPEDENGRLDVDFTKLTDDQMIRLYNMTL